MASNRSTWGLVALAAAIVALPLVLPIHGDFKGSDDRASEEIAQSRPGFEPWFKPFWSPPSGEVESLLFAVQAALGAGVLGYIIGRRRSSSGGDVPDR